MVLDLHCCLIYDEGAVLVADFLKHDETVREVLLYGCYIGTCGVWAIAEALKCNRTVVYLHLGDNPIADVGAKYLIDALNSNTCLRFLNVRGQNSIAPESEAVIDYLTETRNSTLIPTAVRRASLSMIAARRTIASAGILKCLPKEIVKMIATKVWETRKDPVWLEILSETERKGKSGD